MLRIFNYTNDDGSINFLKLMRDIVIVVGIAFAIAVAWYFIEWYVENWREIFSFESKIDQILDITGR